MSELFIRPIPMMTLIRPMSEQVYRLAAYVGQYVVDCVFSWYIEGAKQKIIVDTGMEAEMMKKANIPGFSNSAKHIQTLEQGLAKFGLKPEDIDVVIMTHLHIDHIPQAPLLKNAKFIVQKTELEYHRNPPPPPVDPRPCPVELLDNIDWQVVDGDYEVEEGIRVLFTPGHTPGGQSVAVNTAKGVAVIDSLCTTDDNWNIPEALQPRMEVFCPDYSNDPVQAYESLMRIKKLADINVPPHELRLAWVDRIPE
ncbi:MAG: N-acyl homoserine lactonase family protein [Desulfobacterales bacterium]|nr:N-acyl homoserine lactonase family protein [Desulfobacterales bacterium]